MALPDLYKKKCLKSRLFLFAHYDPLRYSQPAYSMRCLLLVRARQMLAGCIAPAHSMRCSLSVTRQISARASTADACRVYRTKYGNNSVI